MSTATKDVIEAARNHKTIRTCFWLFVGSAAFTGVITWGLWLGKHVTLFIH
jgi:hypothetical protein